MARPQHTHSLSHLEEALTVLFCLIDDAYALLNPYARRYESIKRLSDSEIVTLALFQQLRGVESERARFCGMPSGSSLTCFREWRGSTPPRSTGG
jgi:hypothetical protein